MQTFLVKRERILRLEEFIELEANDADEAFTKAKEHETTKPLAEIIHEQLEVVGGFYPEPVPMDSERF